MSFDWRDFLNLAKELSNYPETSALREAAARSAVSRAYYAAFGRAADYASKNMGFQRTGTAEDHSVLRQLLKQSNRPRTASKLNRLRQWRNRCDYEEDVLHLNDLLQNALLEAERVFADCQ